MVKAFLCALFATVLLSNCSNGDKDVTAIGDTPLEHAHSTDSTSGVSEEETTQTQLAVINRSHYHTIEIRQMKFDPQELSVAKGDTVVWVNNGITAHDVTEQPGEKWTSSSIPVGSSWQMIVNETADYYCSIHVVMKGRLLVK